MSSRARVWTFITYPSSLPENHEEIIEERLHVPFVRSPLHDRDLKPEKDRNSLMLKIFKDEHYHNMIMFTNVKSYKQVKEEFVDPLGGARPEQVHSTQAMVRYFTHEDQPNKTRYDKEDIKCFNGADLTSLWEKNDKEIYNNLNDMLEVIERNNIIEYSDFIDLVRKEYFQEWFPLVTGSYSFFIRNYITSRRHKQADEIAKS